MLFLNKGLSRALSASAWAAIAIIIIIIVGVAAWAAIRHKAPAATTTTTSSVIPTTTITTSPSPSPSPATTTSPTVTTTTTTYKGVVKVGALLPLNLPIGKATLAAIKIAANDINAKGGVLGYKIEVIPYDTEWQADKAVEGFLYLVQHEKVKVIIGPYGSHCALAILNYIPEYHVIVISPGAVSDEIDKKVETNPELYKYWFRANVNATSQAAATWDLLAFIGHTFGWKQVGFVYENLPWVAPHLAYGKIRSQKEGIKVDPIIPVPRDVSSFVDVYQKLLSAKVHYFTYAFSGTEDFVMCRDLEAVKAPLLPVGGGVMLMMENFWNQSKGTAQGCITISWGFPTNITPLTMKYYREYKKIVGIEPFFTAWYAYDALLIWAQAVEKAGTFDPDSVVKVLETETFVGTAGVYKFTKGHSALLGPDYIYPVFFQWQNGKRVVIWPLKLVKPGTKLLLPEVEEGKLIWKPVPWPPKKG